MRLIREGSAKPRLIKTIHRRTGDLHWTQLKTTALRDADGELLGAMTMIEDVTAVKLAEIGTRVLAESGRLLASSLDYEQTLRNITEIAVPSLADYCGVDVVDEAGSLQRVAATHRDPRLAVLAERLATLGDTALGPGPPALRVIATGVSDLYEDINSELAHDDASPRENLWLRELGLRSVLIVPMRVPGRTIGAITLATDESQRRLRDDDVELAEQLGSRAAVAVENSRLHSKLTEVAETLQQALLPAELPDVEGWEIASLYRPTESELRIDVGGDFYELFDHDGVWFAILGDIVGKGVKAASVTALMRHGARVASRAEPSPAQILSRLDEVLAQPAALTTATAICLCLRPGSVVISSAGHPAGIIVSPDGRLREAPTADPLLGAFPGCERHEEEVLIEAGETLVLFTDGVIDTPGEGTRFGNERLRTLLSSAAQMRPREMLASLDRELAEFASLSGTDDVAVLALRLAAES
jgi:serine phosphatase RsbU (regulator of sigma subunit)